MTLSPTNFPTTAEPTTSPTSCEDSLAICDDLASACNDEEDVTEIRAYCPYTCGICSKTPTTSPSLKPTKTPSTIDSTEQSVTMVHPIWRDWVLGLLILLVLILIALLI